MGLPGRSPLHGAGAPVQRKGSPGDAAKAEPRGFLTPRPLRILRLLLLLLLLLLGMLFLGVGRRPAAASRVQPRGAVGPTGMGGPPARAGRPGGPRKGTPPTRPREDVNWSGAEPVKPERARVTRGRVAVWRYVGIRTLRNRRDGRFARRVGCFDAVRRCRDVLRDVGMDGSPSTSDRFGIVHPSCIGVRPGRPGGTGAGLAEGL